MAQLNRITVTGAGVLGGQIAWHSAFKGKTVVVHDISANSCLEEQSILPLPEKQLTVRQQIERLELWRRLSHRTRSDTSPLQFMHSTSVAIP